MTNLDPRKDFIPASSRIEVGIVDGVELEAISLIRNKVGCAKQALVASNIQEGATKEQCSAFITAVIDTLASYQMFETSWWEHVISRYNLDSETFLDFNSGSLYKLKE